jgi:hypothetical protein
MTANGQPHKTSLTSQIKETVMKIKKSHLLLFILIVCVLLLAACGTQSIETEPVAAQSTGTADPLPSIVAAEPTATIAEPRPMQKSDPTLR